MARRALLSLVPERRDRVEPGGSPCRVVAEEKADGQRDGEAEHLVTKTTNDLLVKNSEMLKMNSIETAKENERGIIEIDTLKKTQENLITTIEETLLIQADGRAKRKAAEIEIGRMEEELKQRLIAVHEKTENRPL